MEYGKVSFFMDRFFLKSNFKCLGITTWYLSNLFICAGEVFFFQFYLTYHLNILFVDYLQANFSNWAMAKFFSYFSFW